MPADNFNTNEKQIYFNQIRGVIAEINEAEKYCSITLSVGHERLRYVNFTVKRSRFDEIKSSISCGQKVLAKYYISSKKKEKTWYTTANLLSVEG